jgi:hypothetical protein
MSTVLPTVLTLGLALLWSALIRPNPSPSPAPLSLPQAPPPPPPAPQSPDLPCGFDPTDRTLLKGATENEWCYTIGVPPSAVYDAAHAAECEGFYIDPIVEPADPENYAIDCSSGCQPCAYIKGNDGFYRCKNLRC